MTLRGDWAKLVKVLKQHGWRIESRSRHVFAYAPDGVTRIGCSGSTDPRALRNQLALLRRHGVPV